MIMIMIIFRKNSVSPIGRVTRLARPSVRPSVYRLSRAGFELENNEHRKTVIGVNVPHGRNNLSQIFSSS